MPKIDFSEIREPAPLEPGDYLSTLSAVTYVPKKPNTKADYVKLEFTISEEGPHEGRKAFRNLSLSENSLWAFKQAMIALGADPEDFDGEVDPEEMAKERIGSDAVLSITQQPDQRDPTGERMTANVARIREPSFA